VQPQVAHLFYCGAQMKINLNTLRYVPTLVQSVNNIERIALKYKLSLNELCKFTDDLQLKIDLNLKCATGVHIH
jgi:hypothetical protein